MSPLSCLWLGVLYSVTSKPEWHLHHDLDAIKYGSWTWAKWVHYTLAATLSRVTKAICHLQYVAGPEQKAMKSAGSRGPTPAWHISFLRTKHYEALWRYQFTLLLLKWPFLKISRDRQLVMMLATSWMHWEKNSIDAAWQKEEVFWIFMTNPGMMPYSFKGSWMVKINTKGGNPQVQHLQIQGSECDELQVLTLIKALIHGMALVKDSWRTRE